MIAEAYVRLVEVLLKLEKYSKYPKASVCCFWNLEELVEWRCIVSVSLKSLVKYLNNCFFLQSNRTDFLFGNARSKTVAQ